MTTDEIIKSQVNDDHWSWQCPKEAGGCGYASPWWLRTKADAEAGLAAHRENCRSEHVREEEAR